MPSRLTINVIAVLVVIASIWGYGRYQYSKGHTAARIQSEARALALQQGMQYEKDRADAEYRGAVAARQAAEIALSDQRDRINGLLDQLRRAKATGASSGSDADGSIDWIGLVATCSSEYELVGGHAARLSDKVKGLQDYINAVTLN